MRGLSLRTQLGVFSALFAAGMWMSKVAQPLHFDDAGALVAFGIGYAVMAIAGGFAFAWGVLADRIGGVNAMRIGTLAYAAGISGRVFTDVLPTIACAAVAGAGASLALVGIRPWIRSQASDDAIPAIVGGRNVANQLGVLAGTLGAAVIFAVAGGTDSGPEIALLVAPALVVAGAAWLFVAVSADRPGPVGGKTVVQPRRSFSSLAVRLALVGVISGFYVSLITPFLPLFLTRGGSTDSGAAMVVAAMGVVQLLVTWSITRRGVGKRPFRLFFAAEFITGLSTIGVAVVLDVSVILVAGLLVVRAAFVAVAVVAEETIQYAVLPGASAGALFGIAQTAFLVGDAVGGAVGGGLWDVVGPVGLATLGGVLTITNAIVLPVLLRDRVHAEQTVITT